MKTILFIILCLIAGCTQKTKTVVENHKFDADSVKALIIAKEQIALQRWYNGDPMGFVDNSWNDVTYFDPSVKSRVDSIKNFRKMLEPIVGKVQVPMHRMDKPLVQIYENIALLTFTDVFPARGNDSARWNATEVYEQRNNDWKLIHSHWTEVK